MKSSVIFCFLQVSAIICANLSNVIANEVEYKKFVGESDHPIPFKARLAPPLIVGQTIHAFGRLSADPIRVDFNFHKGSTPAADMPLHLSIRFDEGFFSSKIVYNTFSNGKWSDNEQRISNPFKKNQNFDMRVRISDGKFEVYANRVKIGDFEQRSSLDGIDHISIAGDLSELKLFHYGGMRFAVPYAAVVDLRPGTRLDISGVATGDRFNVALFHENLSHAFEMSFRFKDKVIVRNSMEDNKWGTEERSGVLPISKGDLFDLTIINEPYSYQIFINQKRFTTFAHRGSPRDIKTVEVSGDIDLHTLTRNEVDSQN